MKKIKLGFIGVGFNGQLAHLKNYYKINNCVIVAIAEARNNLRKLVSKKYGIKRQYNNHLDLIKNEKNLDGVVIVTKRNMTGPIALDFLKNNISILTEKPMTSTLQQAHKIVNSIQKRNIIYKIGYNKIHDRGVTHAKKIYDRLVKTKELGKIILVRSHRSSGTGYANIKGDIKTLEKNNLTKPSWPSTPSWLPKKYKTHYEQYINLYCHNINLIRFFVGNKIQVDYANLSDKKMSSVIMKSKNFDIILQTGFFGRSVWDEKFEIYFELGSLKITLPPQHDIKSNATFILEKWNNKYKKIVYNKKHKWSFYYQSRDFIESLMNKRKINLNSGKDALNDMIIVEDIWKKFIETTNVRK